jgi:hypothetical protein
MRNPSLWQGSSRRQLAAALVDVVFGSRKRSTAIQRALAVTKEEVRKMREMREKRS